MEDNTSIIVGVVLGLLCLILVFATISFGVYKYKELEINNFQVTIDNLSDEQKCLHICGFEFRGSAYYDNYKFCVEKCDRISERSIAKGG